MEPCKSFVFMVPGDGFEPSTSGSTIQRSNQLSYPGKVVVAGPGLMRLHCTAPASAEAEYSQRRR